MKGVELYGRVRYAVQIEGLSHREAARQFGIDPRTVAKMVKFFGTAGLHAQEAAS
jgi:transposase